MLSLTLIFVYCILQIVIGRQARMTSAESLEALDAAVASWNHGKGEWATAAMKVCSCWCSKFLMFTDKSFLDQTRLAAMNKFVEILKTKRDTIVKVLMWEICKVKADAEKEFDRTIDYIVATIKAAKELRNSESTFQSDGGIIAQIRRSPLGVMLNLGMTMLESTTHLEFSLRSFPGPFNYPFNETYTTLIPAILMGNSVVMKLPNVGCLGVCAPITPQLLAVT
jgi:glyceraldehyde-3-phosphate dehydrogenase (NADP+)